MNNLQATGWDFTDLKYIDFEEGKQSLYLLNKGDILFNRTNSKELVGKCEVFQEDGEWAFASYLIRARLDNKKALPRFVTDFLNTKAGRIQIDRISRQIIGMTNVNAEELRDLVIPLPPLPEQERLVAVMEAARTERKRKLKEAAELLNALDSWLLDQLGITSPPKDTRNIYAVKRIDLIATSRLNADYFHPERILSIRNIKGEAGRLAIAPLSEIVEFRKDSLKTPTGRYLGLANIRSNTGELVDSDEEVTGSVLEFRENDVLFGRLRPYLNKVYRAEFDGVCSPEFHVMRVLDEGSLHPAYLAAILRSSIIVAQTKHMMTGNTHPRLTNDDVVNLVIPIPSPEVQTAIAAEIDRRKEDSRRLEAEAEKGWEDAKARFECELLGGDN